MRTMPRLESYDVVKLNGSLNYSLLSGGGANTTNFLQANSGEIRFDHGLVHFALSCDLHIYKQTVTNAENSLNMRLLEFYNRIYK